MKAIGWVNGNGTIKWLGDKQPAPFTTMFVEVPIEAEERDPIGYTLDPIYAARPGSVVTQAFIMCSTCGDAISSNGGPRYHSVCLKCIEQLDLINKLKA